MRLKILAYDVLSRFTYLNQLPVAIQEHPPGRGSKFITQEEPANGEVALGIVESFADSLHPHFMLESERAKDVSLHEVGKREASILSVWSGD